MAGWLPNRRGDFMVSSGGICDIFIALLPRIGINEGLPLSSIQIGPKMHFTGVGVPGLSVTIALAVGGRVLNI